MDVGETGELGAGIRVSLECEEDTDMPDITQESYALDMFSMY